MILCELAHHRCELKNGFAFVTYEDDRDADDAVRKLNNSELGGGRC
jgi:RNA recognition motif-containing protein